jgi:hypothetical protein
MWLFSFLTNPRTADADHELRSELREFAYDGLVQLSNDLEQQAVKRGTWDGCVLSYRRGYAGSVDCDRKGRRGNVFTRFWDAERVDEMHVLKLVRDELEARRQKQSPAPSAHPQPEVVA